MAETSKLLHVVVDRVNGNQIERSCSIRTNNDCQYNDIDFIQIWPVIIIEESSTSCLSVPPEQQAHNKQAQSRAFSLGLRERELLRDDRFALYRHWCEQSLLYISRGSRISSTHGQCHKQVKIKQELTC